jgi:chemotaxis protein methyltransferase CheR
VERWPDLERGLIAAAPELGFETPEEVARWFLSKPRGKKELEALAAHLTIGETYFFREPKSFESLERVVLPALVAARRCHAKRLRIWSAGCCTGEETYSIAIAVSRVVPDPAEWQITILGTDVNTRFLQRAEEGVYGEWSFRGVPEIIRETWFRCRSHGRWEVRARLKKLVKFACLNLVEGIYPSLSTNTNAMDVIFCRNVLMYFTRAQARSVVSALHRALLPDGWLFVGASEGSSTLFADFSPGLLPGAVTYRRIDSPRPAHSDAGEDLAKWNERRSVGTNLTRKQKRPRVLESTDQVLSAMRLANQGELKEALAACEQALRRDKLNAAHHYLHGLILQGQGALDLAATAFRRAIFLQPDFVVAHFALGKLFEHQGRHRDAGRSFENARQLLRAHESGAVLPQSDGLTAGRLLAILSAPQKKSA